MKWMAKALEDLVWVSQLGLSLIMPLLLLLWLCYWLVNDKGMGTWVYIPGFLFGLGGGCSSFRNFWKLMQSRNARAARENPRAQFFNRHD